MPCAPRVRRPETRRTWCRHCWPVMPARKWSCAFFHLGLAPRRTACGPRRDQHEPVLAFVLRAGGDDPAAAFEPFQIARDRRFVQAHTAGRLPPGSTSPCPFTAISSANCAASSPVPSSQPIVELRRRRAPPDARSRTRRRISISAVRLGAGAVAPCASRLDQHPQRPERRERPCTRRSPGSPSTAAIDRSAPWRRRRWWRSG